MTDKYTGDYCQISEALIKFISVTSEFAKKEKLDLESIERFSRGRDEFVNEVYRAVKRICERND